MADEEKIEIVEIQSMDDDGCPNKPTEEPAAAANPLPSVSQLLKDAKAVIADPRKWCIRQAALDNNGMTVEANSPKAEKWCAIGALWKSIANRGVREDDCEYGTEDDSEWQKRYILRVKAQNALDLVAVSYERKPGRFLLSITDLNDYMNDHKLVMEVYDKAIAAAEAAEHEAEAAAAAALAPEHGGESG